MRMKKRVIMTLSALFLTLAAVTVLLVVNVNAAYEEYGLYIGGKQVTSSNLSGKGWRFEPDTNTLVLNGFEITSGGHFHKKQTTVPHGCIPSSMLTTASTWI